MDDLLIIYPKTHLRGEDGYRTFSIRIKSETADSLDKVAQLTQNSRNEIIRIFLEYALSHCHLES